MPLYIRDEEVRRLAARVAQGLGVTITDAVRKALERELAALEREEASRERRLRARFARLDALPATSIRRRGDVRRPRAAKVVQIVVDNSALVAVLLGEPERESFHRTLLSNQPLMSVASVAETFMVAQGRLSAEVVAEAEGMLADYQIEVVPVASEDLAELRHAVLTYGKGRHAPPAGVNFGDIFAYALAKRLRVPLLFKGQDLAATDITVAISP